MKPIRRTTGAAIALARERKGNDDDGNGEQQTGQMCAMRQLKWQMAKGSYGASLKVCDSAISVKTPVGIKARLRTSSS